jgi:ligand-binding sensor domain-containing protein
VDVRTFTSTQGLPSEDIWQIVDGGKGDLWLGARQRILRLRKAELLNDRRQPGDRFPLCARFRVAKGWPESCRAATTTARSPFGTDDGRLWFATHAGLAMIDPLALTDATNLSPVVIETISARNGRGTVFRCLSDGVPARERGHV